MKIALLLIGQMAFAAGGAHHGGDGHIPFVVVYQAINLLILGAAIYYFASKPVVEMFKTKKTEFLAAQEKANSALRLAEEQHSDFKHKLSKIETNQAETISRAKADAAELRAQILADANALAKRMKDEAAAAAKIEVQRAKNELRDQLLKEAFERANKDISSKATKEDQTRLQQHFIDKVGVAQ